MVVKTGFTQYERIAQIFVFVDDLQKKCSQEKLEDWDAKEKKHFGQCC